MIRLHTKTLVTGAVLVVILAIVANVVSAPIWTVYVAFATILAVAAFVDTKQSPGYRGLLGRRPRPR